MSDFETIVRPNQTKDINPPKTAAIVSCDESPKTVIMQFGKGPYAKIGTINYSYSVKNYMTKQQKELDSA